MGRSTVPLFVLVEADYSPFKRHTFPDELDVCISVNSPIQQYFPASSGLRGFLLVGSAPETFGQPLTCLYDGER